MAKFKRRYWIVLSLTVIVAVGVWFFYLSRGLSTADCQRVTAGMHFNEVEKVLGGSPDLMVGAHGSIFGTWEVFDGQIDVVFRHVDDDTLICTGSGCRKGNPIGLLLERWLRKLRWMF